MMLSRFFSPRLILAFSLATVLLSVWMLRSPKADARPAVVIGDKTTYEQEWHRVDSLVNQGLYQSAEELAGQILEKARKEKNDPQLVKALLCRFRMGDQYKENNKEAAIYETEAELKNAKAPLKQVLHSLLGEMYWHYYEDNRWTIYDRARTVGMENDSINTWDVTTIVEHAIRNYKASLTSTDTLQKTPVGKYDAILQSGDSLGRAFRPTMYDLLANRALEIFTNGEPEVTFPADHFSVDSAIWFEPATQFVKENIKTASDDTIATYYEALKVYQQLLSFHLNDADASPLIDADLNRLNFIEQVYSGADKDTLYEVAMKKLADTYPKNPWSAYVLFTLAQHDQQLGTDYEPFVTEAHRWKVKEAATIAERVVKDYPKTYGADNCAILLKNIYEKSLMVTTEKVVVPSRLSPALFTYRNLDSVYFRIVKMPEETPNCSREDSCVDIYLHLPVVAQWSEKVPANDDFQSHSAQIKLPAIPSGKYVLLAGARKDFAHHGYNEKVSYGFLDASMIAYLESATASGDNEYLVTNRQTGEPLKGAKATVMVGEYEKHSDKYVFRKQKTYTTDKMGRVEIPAEKERKEYYIEFEWKGDKLSGGYDYAYGYDYYRQEKKPTETFFFTDRSIYRPGQTVYFKGICVEKGKGKTRLITNHKTTVTFYDVNDQEIKSLDLETNDFGSIAGSFVIPNNGLTGDMSIRTEDGTAYFSVEEYKRPQFDVTLDQVREEIRLGEKVNLSGTAKTFSGAPLDHATVKYNITRTQGYYYWNWDRSRNTQFMTGTLTTNDTGGFFLSFIAEVDPGVAVQKDTRYSFTATFDVTDVTGETHSANKWLSIGQQSLSVDVSAGSEYFKDPHDSVWVYTRNVDGYDIPANVTLKVYRLQQPARPFRERIWQRPDKFIYTKEEWSKWFPEDIYDNEDDQSTWKRTETVLEKKFNSGDKKPVALDGKEKWASGTYEYEAITHDKSGSEVKTNGYFRVSEVDEKKFPFTDAIVGYTPNNYSKPGEKVTSYIGTAFTDANIFYEIEQEGNTFGRGWMKASDETKPLEILLEEKHRGNVNIHFLLVHNNRLYSNDQFISVPFQDESLDITFETFRDKLLPGQQEEWRLKIKGRKGEKVAAEVLAGMYDASLDEFRNHSWFFYPWDYYSAQKYWTPHVAEAVNTQQLYTWEPEAYRGYEYPDYDRVKFTASYYGDYWTYEETKSVGLSGGTYNVEVTDSNGATVTDSISAVGSSSYMWSAQAQEKDEALSFTSMADGEANAIPVAGKVAAERMVVGKDDRHTDLKDVQARKNLNETVFFFPQLATDSSGSVIIKFTMGEALTKWNFMAFAHTKDLRYDMKEKTVVTQKDLMITPNAPRFLREGDQLTFTAKVANLTTKELNGNAQLQLFDALTMQPVDAKFYNLNSKVPFKAAAGQSAGVSWDLKVPEGVNAVVYKVVAAADNFSDGEQNALPVLSNRMLITETMPFSIRGGQSKEFRFEKLLSQSNGSSTLRNQKLTLEFTANPAWYAVQALPYMMEYPYECAEQTFNRFYSNCIASSVANSSPKIRAVFDTWKNQQPDAFLSGLEKNQDLKNVVLSETPWVLDAKDESERKRRVGLLFDMNHMADETGRAFHKLQLMQSGDGGWPWFEGMESDRYITQYIVAGFGRMNKLNLNDPDNSELQSDLTNNAIRYMDLQIKKDYEWVLRHGDKNLNNLSYYAVQYLYARSYFTVDFEPGTRVAYEYYFNQAKKYWTKQSRYMQGMLALVFSRDGDSKTADDVIKSLKETALHSEEMGMYWKENTGGWYWYEAPIETQSLLIEAFKEVKNDTAAVDEMRMWLLKNKQTNQWSTTKATADACYALLIDGTSWLSTESKVEIIVGAQTIDPKALGVQEETGTGYFKTSWPGDEVKPEMGKVKVSKPDAGVSWGALYWQYFEDIDKITAAQTPLKIVKQLFIQKNTSTGAVIIPVTDQTELHPGDKLTVRIELKNDRDMEYVHLKDMRASGFEPVNVFSSYKYQDGLGYYESTKDASTDFFFNYLPKGVHVFEYPLTVIHAGDFSNGLATAQCMYAPEFSAHSEGMRVKVAKN